MNFRITLIIFVSFFSLLSGVNAEAARVKDLAQLHGVRSNQLLGYGLVSGLNGTGDDMKKISLYPAGHLQHDDPTGDYHQPRQYQ